MPPPSARRVRLFFHLALDPSGMVMTAVIVVLHLFLAWAYRDSFRGVLTPFARPAGQ